MRNHSRSIAALLAAASVCGVLASCGDSGKPSETTADSVTPPPNWKRLPMN